MAIVLFLGFCSGLPLSLTGGTLQAWMKEAGVDLATIGRFALVGLPYTAKFLWSPFMDSAAPPFWGRRRGWAMLTQLALVGAIVSMSFIHPSTDLEGLVGVAIALAFFSASQDIVLDAFRNELLKDEERGAGAGVYVMGYRLAMLVSGAVALILADQMPWHSVYLVMAGVMAVGTVATVLAPEPEFSAAELQRASSLPWRERITEPFIEFFSRAGAVEILLFVMIYKLPTMMATALTTPFLMGVGFSKTEIGAVTKVAGLIATIVGTLAGGALMTKLGTKRALWVFGVIQATAGLSFILVSVVGKNNLVLSLVITVENFMMGLGVAAIQAFMMQTCSRQFTATQFSLLSSLTAVSRVVLVAQAGVLAEKFGWIRYFVFSVLLAIPGLLLLLRYDSWQTLKTHQTTRLEKFQGALFVTGLGMIAAEPLFAWQQMKPTGTLFAQCGACAIGLAICVGFLPKRFSGQAPQ